VQVKRDDAVANIEATAASLQQRLSELRTQRQELRAPLADLQARISSATDEALISRLQREYTELESDLSYELDLVRSQAEATTTGLADLELQAELASFGEARIVQIAAPPANTSNPPLSRNLALAGVLGLLAGGGLALLAETRDNTFKSSADIQRTTSLPVLSSVPEARKDDQAGIGLATLRAPEGGYANAYHRLRSAVDFASLDNEITSLLVTSPSPSEGKSTTASNLAIAIGSVGKRTVLLDVDFRRPTVHKIHGVPQAPGLSDFILNGATGSVVAHTLAADGVPDSLIVTSGTTPPSPASFVGTARFLQALKWFEDKVDVVVIDSPPVLAVSDAHTLAKHVDAVVLTVRANETTSQELAETISVLTQVGANILGIVLIGVDRAETYGRNYYYYNPDTAEISTGLVTDLAGNGSNGNGHRNGNGNGKVNGKGSRTSGSPGGVFRSRR
jgi:capsular exopolysaccharide synthesis family protein